MKSALNSNSQRFSSPLGSTSFLFLFTTVFLSLNLVHSTFSQAWQGRSSEGLFTPWCKISKKLWNPCRCLAGRRLASVRVTIFDDRLPSLCLQSTRHQIAVAKQPMHSSYQECVLLVAPYYGAMDLCTSWSQTNLEKGFPSGFLSVGNCVSIHTGVQ